VTEIINLLRFTPVTQYLMVDTYSIIL